MLHHYTQVTRNLLSWIVLIISMVFAGHASAAMVEYKASLFGAGMQVHYCIDLDSRGTILGDYNETEGTLSNIRGALDFVTITEGFIKRGYNNVKNYVLGTFNDNAPEFLRDKNIFVDLSRGAEYEETKVTANKVREWGWAMYYDPSEYSTAEQLFANRDFLKTVMNPYKTFAQLCPNYAGDSAGGDHGWCAAGVEFFADYGTPAPVPLPAAFYLLATGVIGLVSFARRRNSAALQ